MIDHLKVLKIIEIYLSLLKSELIIETSTVEIWISNPTPFNQSIFQVFVSSCDDENFLSVLQTIFFLPLAQVSNVGKTSHFSFLSFGSFLIILLTIFFIFVFIFILTFFPLFLVQLIIVNTIHNILFNSHHDILFKLFFELFFLGHFFLFFVLLLSPLFFDLLAVLLILFFEIFVSLGHLVLSNLDQRFKFFSRVTSDIQPSSFCCTFEI